MCAICKDVVANAFVTTVNLNGAMVVMMLRALLVRGKKVVGKNVAARL